LVKLTPGFRQRLWEATKVWHVVVAMNRRYRLPTKSRRDLESFVIFCLVFKRKKHESFIKTLKLRCDTRFQCAFTACSCIFKEITYKTQPHAVNARWKRVSQQNFNRESQTLIDKGYIRRGVSNSKWLAGRMSLKARSRGPHKKIFWNTS